MESLDALNALAREMRYELTSGILPYWREHTVDRERGGFYGQITGRGDVVPDAPKGAVLNARILWAFSDASRMLGDGDTYRPLADRAYAYLEEHFWDRKHGGIYWMLSANGEPTEPKKQVYAQAFAVYAMAEYHRLTGRDESLERAVRLFRLIEEHAFDDEEGGYFEAYSRDWELLADVRLSEKDVNEKKTMNTHLHVLEAYTNLYREWPDSTLESQLRGAVRLFLDTILDAETNHLVGFFDDQWTPRTGFVSYGHDIEASWLLVEAAEVLDDASLLDETQSAALRLARVTQAEGQDEDGGLFYERSADGTLDDDKHCWPQVEAIVGFVNAHEISGEHAFLDAAAACWAFTQEHIVDSERGGWFFSVSRAGVPHQDKNKVGPWKGPYHGTRACLEVMRRAHPSGTPASSGPSAGASGLSASVS
jgi:mannobiose 2-epimerase